MEKREGDEVWRLRRDTVDRLEEARSLPDGVDQENDEAECRELHAKGKWRCSDCGRVVKISKRGKLVKHRDPRADNEAKTKWGTKESYYPSGTVRRCGGSGTEVGFVDLGVKR